MSPARWPGSTRLGDCTAGRDNDMQLLRVLAAAAVLLFHCYALTDHWTDEPLWRAAPPLNLGALGVEVFFVISGFLVTQSWLAREHLASFAVARALRIYPALVAATILTVIAMAALGLGVDVRTVSKAGARVCAGLLWQVAQARS